MTIRYAIVAFPALEGAERIEAVRARFDPLAPTLAAHVTVVFPCLHEGSAADLSSHMARVVAGVPPVDLTLSELFVDAGGYIMLNVAGGAERFMELHRLLHTGVLASHRSLAHVYRPHVTVGRIMDPEQLTSTAELVSRELARPIIGRVMALALFRLDDAGGGTVVSTSDLDLSAVRTTPST